MKDRHFSIHQLERRATQTLSLVLLAVLLSLVFASAPHALAQDLSKSHRKILVMHQPDYPYVLTNGHFEGEVRLEATVLPNGTVAKVDSKGGNPMLAKYAMEAVMKWKYAPGPAQTVEEVSFKFNSQR
jgi:TonB family protein